MLTDNADLKPSLRSKLHRPHSTSNKSLSSLHNSMKYRVRWRRLRSPKWTLTSLNALRRGAASDMSALSRAARRGSGIGREPRSGSGALRGDGFGAGTRQLWLIGRSHCLACQELLGGHHPERAPETRRGRCDLGGDLCAPGSQGGRNALRFSRKRKASKSPARHVPATSNRSTPLADAAAGALVASPGCSLPCSDSTLLTLADELFSSETVISKHHSLFSIASQQTCPSGTHVLLVDAQKVVLPARNSPAALLRPARRA